MIVIVVTALPERRITPEDYKYIQLQIKTMESEIAQINKEEM